ncbi:BREX-6 system adenine-specific DNA-methyltransferase PglX [Nannocystis sp.]|uniref:BREX-6 system adenine-specific DNA-methyltransferase PglX n=1 Tax=Nannocystis sp. TaxID=1962667 RepID=UPI0025D396DD|nr:BREX-6 system adenine-specific DNA-methyltransferase PglX [Nannocystis sp.]
MRPHSPAEVFRDDLQPLRTQSALLIQRGRIEFNAAAFQAIDGGPLVYWWDQAFLDLYASTPKVSEIGAVRQGLTTSNNDWFVRLPWETDFASLRLVRETAPRPDAADGWAPYIKGAKGVEWIEPVSYVVDWRRCGLNIKVLNESLYGSHSRSVRSEDRYFEIGSAFTTMGQRFGGRSHRFRSICDAKGRTVYGIPHPKTTCLLNSRRARFIVESLNPTIDFSVGDVNRLPLFPIASADDIFVTVERAFGEHESHREPSVEFRRPGPSPWRHAQAWAQLSVDRPEGAPLPKYLPEYDPEPASDHLSNAVGVALGRFGANGEGILDPTKDDLGHALPAGILFLDTTLTPHDHSDGLGHPAAAPLHAAWRQHGPAIAQGDDLRSYLADSFFDLHRKMYDSRPIHWPLSSEKRTFVAWVTIHRWTATTLRTLLAEHLVPRLNSLDRELADLRAARDGGDKKTARAADKRFAQVKKPREELAAFIAAVEQCAEKGPPPEGPKCPPRAVDARYIPDLDDGVMINSAALWPLLAPQWKDPRKWWRELASADAKDYDWAHLAMRYWPDRVDAKCKKDPSLAVAHGCFWKYHPDRAWAWELRLQDELAPDFRITESPYRQDGGDAAHRAQFLATRGPEAIGLLQTELLRRIRKHKRPLATYTLQHTGLWSTHPEACWNLEHAVMLKQKVPFVLFADDESVARAAFNRANPDAVTRRGEQLRVLALQQSIFDADDEPDDDAAPDDETSDDDEEDA